MLNNEKLQKLFTLATGKEPAKPAETNKKLSKARIEKSKYSLAKKRGLIQDPMEAWSRWYREEVKNITQDDADDFWKEAEAEFPGSPEQAKDWVRSETSNQVQNNDPVLKDISMRNTLTKSPTWLAKEMLPELAQTNSAVSTQNLTKVNTVYRKTLTEKLRKMNLSDLDPEVPTDVHVEDAIKLEMMGLLDAARIQNGRFVVLNNGQPQPAFSLESSSDVGISQGPEMELIQTVAEPLFKKEIDSALQLAIDKVGMDNTTSRAVVRNMLGNGEMPIEDWKGALSVLGNSEDVISAGMDGMVNQNSFMDEEDILTNTLDIANARRGLQ
jgi:hypothetical protein